MIARSFLLGVGVVIGAVFMHYYDRSHYQTQLDTLEHAHTLAQIQMRQQGNIHLDALKNKTNDLEVRAIVSDSIAQQYAKELSSLQAQLSQAQTELAFYEQIVPSGPMGSVNIRSFDATREGALVHYQVLLSRQAKANDMFKGRLQFKAKGVLEGKQRLIDLMPAQVDKNNQLTLPKTQKDTQDTLKKKGVPPILDLQFSRWQQAKGSLVLPPTFELQELILNILEGNQVRAHKTVIFQS